MLERLIGMDATWYVEALEALVIPFLGQVSELGAGVGVSQQNEGYDRVL